MADKSNKPTPPASSPTLPRGLLSRRGGVVNPSARMPSLRSPRDLTLGGKPKKSFKPTIPVRKDKSREEPSENNVASSSSSAPKEREKRSFRDGSGRGRGRGRGRRQAETIQTHSIFEQGPMERSRGRGSSSSSYAAGGGGDAHFTSKNVGGSKKISFKNEDGDSDTLSELLRDDFIDDGRTREDSRYKLVQLPLVASSLPKKEIKEKVEKVEDKMEVDEDKESKMDVDSDVKVKTEPDSDKEFLKPAPVADKLKPKVSPIKDTTSEKVTCSSLFSGDQLGPEGELVFFQLPDTLPSFPSSKDDEDSYKQQAASKKPIIKQEKDAAGSSQQQKESKDDSSSQDCCLKDLPEGYLGKLQVMKSGKTRLVLGNFKLDVSMGSPCGFLQDLVSVKLGGDKGGELITLGHIRHRVVCTPDFEQLLKLGST